MAELLAQSTTPDLGDLGSASSAAGAAGTAVGNAAPGVQRLLAEAAGQAPLADIAGFDKVDGTLSGYDWYAGNGFIPELLPVLLANAPSDIVYQDTIWFLYEMTTLEADRTKQRVYDLAAGTLRAEPLPEGVTPSAIEAGSSATRRQLTANDQIVDNTLTKPGTPWSGDQTFDPVGRTKRDDFARTVGAAMAARARLADDFGFDPDDRSLKAVTDLQGMLKPQQLQPFLDAYLTAFFVSGAPPGGGLHYDYDFIDADPANAVATFFGNPPGCDQLPDGRGIIDCKGFSAVSQLLFRELSCEPNQRNATEYTYQFAVPNHQMALLRSGPSVMAVDNNEVVSLDMSEGELAHLDTLHESCFEDRFGGVIGPTEGSLSGPIDLNALPTLQAFVRGIFQKYNLPGQIRANWYAVLAVMKPDGR